MTLRSICPLVLASQSPRRKSILRFAGIPCRVIRPVGVIERRKPGESPSRMAVRLALEKARSVSERVPDSLVLGADTVVVCRGKLFGKPKNRGQARRMIRNLEGRAHVVWTGVALIKKEAGVIRTHVEKSKVYFRNLGVKELEDYLDTSEAYDKAGAYAIQGNARQWIKRLEGDYFNVMGLPLHWVIQETNNILNRLGKF